MPTPDDVLQETVEASAGLYIRVTKGVARYATDTSFSVPTSAYPRS